uniref:Lysosomal alpha-mannosidase n=1 Tax=Esox lucius TaxID=8010 RepID=A0AAY5JWD1_ESOLU
MFSKMATTVHTPFVLLLFQIGVFSLPVSQTPQESPTCGYKSCHAIKPGMLNVHLVPHTHDDVGWLKTVDQYFYGARNDIQHAGVQYILDSVVDQLLKNPDRRFIYVETAFFYRWWKRQSGDMQDTVKQLVDEGRLEFVNGGWCMSDEATTHYSAVVDQMTIGLRFLNDTFGPCGRPRVAWHIDPFGHAREHASVFAQMGYDGFFFGRLDYQDRSRRKASREQEMVWRASESLVPPVADLFTGILPNGYNPPEGFCWDQLCDDPPIRDDPDLEDYNVEDVVSKFLTVAQEQAKVYKTNHIIMTMGSDFQYENANLWYKNLDKLIRYVNQKQVNGSNIHVLYSTPSCYLQELHRANLSCPYFPMRIDDFFPYADAAHDFWTGYFTSRPALKRYERISNSYLQVICNQMEVLGGPTSRNGSFGVGNSDTMKKAMAVAQHHDAVSGTEKQHVADDYARRLANGWTQCQVLVSNTLAALSGSSAPRVYCEHLNISVCPLTESSTFDPEVMWVFRRLCSTSLQVVPVSQATVVVRRDRGYAVNELLFQVRAPPMGYSTYSVSLLQKGPPPASPFPRAPKDIQNKVRAWRFLKVTFDPETGLLSSLSNLETQQTVRLSQNFYWYNASDGNNKDSKQMSGAYIFRPNSSTTFIISKTAKIETVQNSVVQEVRQWFSPWVSQVVRLYADSRVLELEWTVGPVPIGDNMGKEVITRFDTSINSSGIFYTDSNGREVLQRRKDYRPTWTLTQTEPVAGNYYPINSRAYIKDEKDQLTVVTDRSQGGGSIQDGSLEIMLHRRLLHDDVRGVGEPLNEASDLYPEGLVVRGRLLLSLNPPAVAANTHRPLAQEVVLQPLITFTEGLLPPNTSLPLDFSGLQTALPPAVHLLTVSQWDPDLVLLRLEHQYEARDSKEHSQPVTVNLQVSPLPSTFILLTGLSPSYRCAVCLSGEKPLPKTKGDPSVWEVTLKPMEIRTFLLRVRLR